MSRNKSNINNNNTKTTCKYAFTIQEFMWSNEYKLNKVFRMISVSTVYLPLHFPFFCLMGANLCWIDDDCWTWLELEIGIKMKWKGQGGLHIYPVLPLPPPPSTRSCGFSGRARSPTARGTPCLFASSCGLRSAGWGRWPASSRPWCRTCGLGRWWEDPRQAATRRWRAGRVGLQNSKSTEVRL